MAKFNPDIRPDMLEPDDNPYVADIGGVVPLRDGNFGLVVSLDPIIHERVTIDPPHVYEPPLGVRADGYIFFRHTDDPSRVSMLTTTKRMRDLARTALSDLRSSIAALTDMLEEAGVPAGCVGGVLANPDGELASYVQSLEVLAGSMLQGE